MMQKGQNRPLTWLGSPPVGTLVLGNLPIPGTLLVCQYQELPLLDDTIEKGLILFLLLGISYTTNPLHAKKATYSRAVLQPKIQTPVYNFQILVQGQLCKTGINEFKTVNLKE